MFLHCFNIGLSMGLTRSFFTTAPTVSLVATLFLNHQRQKKRSMLHQRFDFAAFFYVDALLVRSTVFRSSRGQIEPLCKLFYTCICLISSIKVSIPPNPDESRLVSRLNPVPPSRPGLSRPVGSDPGIVPIPSNSTGWERDTPLQNTIDSYRS